MIQARTAHVYYTSTCSTTTFTRPFYCIQCMIHDEMIEYMMICTTAYGRDDDDDDNGTKSIPVNNTVELMV